MAGAAEHKYSYDDGDIVLAVESTPYRVHSFHLQRATAHFDKDLQAFGEGDGKPITLEDVKRTDFENLLWFFYESAYNWHGLVEGSLREQWESVLLLADKFEMRQVAIVASHALDRMGVLDDIRKISLCMKHIQDQDWALEELVRTIDRVQPLSQGEGHQLGVSMTVAIAAARDAVYRSKLPSVVGECSAVEDCPQPESHYPYERSCVCFHGVHICSKGHRTVCSALGKLTSRDAVREVLSQEINLFAPPVDPAKSKRRVSRGANQGDASFMIEGKSYRLHSYHLRRASKVFADMYLLPKPATDTDKQEENVIILDVKAADFWNLIWFFYDSPYEWTPTIPYPSISQAKWESVLRLADMFDMDEIAQVATYALDRCGTLSDMRKIALCVRHQIPREWALEALKSVCSRDEVISVEEAKGMGVVMMALVAQARERFYRAGSRASALEEIVRDVMLK